MGKFDKKKIFIYDICLINKYYMKVGFQNW